MREQPRGAVGVVAEVDQGKRLRDAVALGRIEPRVEAETHALVGLHRQLQVLEHAVLLEYRGLLELAADAGVGDFRFGQFCKIDGLAKEHGTRVGPGLAGDHVHHGGLAGAIGADDAAQLAVVDIEG